MNRLLQPVKSCSNGSYPEETSHYGKATRKIDFLRYCKSVLFCFGLVVVFMTSEVHFILVGRILQLIGFIKGFVKISII